MIFPPIFSLILFFILDILEFVFDIFGISAPVGVFLSVFSTMLYIILLFIKYGPKKARKRLFEFKKVPKTKAFKKVMKVFGASVIPFLTTWAVWDDYKEDLEEKKQKELEIKTQNQKFILEKEQNVQKELEAQKINQIKEEADNENNQNIAENNQDNQEGINNRWIKNNKVNPKNNQQNKEENNKQNKEGENVKNNKTTFEYLGGKTGFNQKDYENSTLDFSRTDAYQDYLKKEKIKNEAKIKAVEIEAKRRKIQGIKAEQDLRQELFERSKRRFGEKAKETQKLDDKYRENIDDKIKIL